MAYKIIYDKNKCIGVGQCALVSSLWSVNNKGKAELQGAKEVKPGVFELEIPDSLYRREMDAKNQCPVAAIQVVKL